MRQISSAYRHSTSPAPRKPYCSPTAANTKSVSSSGTKLPVIWVAFEPAAGLLPRADRDLRLGVLIAGIGFAGLGFLFLDFLEVRGGVQEGRQPFDLVGLEHVHADRRRRHQHERDATRTRSASSAASCCHGVPATSSMHERDRHVDHARAEVRLGDHEHRRHQRREHHARGRVALAQPPRAVDDERRQREDQQHLAELGGLEGEERQADRPLGAFGRVARARARRGC